MVRAALCTAADLLYENMRRKNVVNNKPQSFFKANIEMNIYCLKAVGGANMAGLQHCHDHNCVSAQLCSEHRSEEKVN